MAHELEKTKQNLLNRDYTTNTDEHMNKCETKPCVGQQTPDSRKGNIQHFIHILFLTKKMDFLKQGIPFIRTHMGGW